VGCHECSDEPLGSGVTQLVSKLEHGSEICKIFIPDA
jgi:hypothetical protein